MLLIAVRNLQIQLQAKINQIQIAASLATRVCFRVRERERERERMRESLVCLWCSLVRKSLHNVCVRALQILAIKIQSLVML